MLYSVILGGLVVQKDDFCIINYIICERPPFLHASCEQLTRSGCMKHSGFSSIIAALTNKIPRKAHVYITQIQWTFSFSFQVYLFIHVCC